MDALNSIYDRDLDKLIFEISSFKKEENLWKTKDGIANSAGNLCLHLVGNLNHFIGAVIGDSGYIRNRDLEFSESDIPSSRLIDAVNETKKIVNSTLTQFEKAQLDAPYPINVFGDEMTNEFFILHLLTHLNYHVGQINYLRRILEP